MSAASDALDVELHARLVSARVRGADLEVEQLLTALARLYGGSGAERQMELYRLDLAWHRRELQ